MFIKVNGLHIISDGSRMKNNKHIRTKTIEYLQEIIDDGLLIRDENEEYEMAIGFCSDLELAIEEVDGVVDLINKILYEYCGMHCIMICKI